jgi:hypothetical protein
MQDRDAQKISQWGIFTDAVYVDQMSCGKDMFFG